MSHDPHDMMQFEPGDLDIDLRMPWAFLGMGLRFNPSSWWLGAAWLGFERRLVVQPIPCLGVWLGRRPNP